jgi:DNA helicase HerA-like ATPase
MKRSFIISLFLTLTLIFLFAGCSSRPDDQIARRGRKRWLALAFVSQQPSHIPDEIFELCNTRIIHSVKSDYNLRPLKQTSGDVLSELWDMLPGLGPGEALITCPQFTHTVLVDMRPSATKRRMID